MLEKNTK
jgi:hypothetical protein